MELVHYSVEFIKNLLSFWLDVLVLLEFYFVFPFGFLVVGLYSFNLHLAMIQLIFNLNMERLFLLKLYLRSLSLMKRLRHILISPVVLSMLFLRHRFFLLTGSQLFLQKLNDIQIGGGDLWIVCFDVCVLLFMLESAFFNFLVFSCFYCSDLSLAFALHLTT